MSGFTENKNNWPEWSMFVIKSIERIESSLKECNKKIDDMVDRFNTTIIKIKAEIEKRIDQRTKELDDKYGQKIEALRKEDVKHSKDILKNKVKLGGLILILSGIGSAILTYIFKFIL